MVIRNGGIVAPLLLMLSLASAQAVAAEIQVHTDRDPVALNESFRITFEAEGDVDDDPDLSPLNRDFKILSTSQSSNLSIINGAVSRKKTWTLTALPRRQGRLTIPAIAFGRDHSPPLELQVGNGSGSRPATSGAAPGGDVYMEVEARPLHPYVQSQVTYVVRLYRATPTANASLTDPETDKGEAVIERLGDDRSYETRVGGRSYQVVERRFAVYPQASGKLRISPLTFQGQIGGGPFSLFSPFSDDTRTIIRQSAPVELDVRAMPAGFTGSHWLPARNVTIEESWSTDPPQIHVGEPITRTLAVVADGLTASQLPEFQNWVPDGFKAYPDQPVMHDDKSAKGIVGRREERTAIIPSAPGTYTLPELSIPWWNTATDSMEQALLPQRVVKVLPAAGDIPDAGMTKMPSAFAPNLPAPEAQRPTGEARSVAPSSPSPRTAETATWQWVSVVLGLGWGLTLAFWWWSRHGRKKPRATSADDSTGRALGEIKLACRRNDASAAKQAVLRWAALRWPEDPPRTIAAAASRLGDAVAAELQRLDCVLYGRGQDPWIGDGLWNALAQASRMPAAENTAPGSDLQPLHRL